MKPVLVLQHLHSDGPGYLATWLARRGVPYAVRNSAAGESFPASAAGFSGVAILGGEMSANDPLPSLRHAEQLILEAMDRGVPVIGHCLGGQLMARALGEPVTRSPRPEVGWHAVDLLPGDETQDWFGDASAPRLFQWHDEAFGLPRGTTALATNDNCRHQAFAIGPHLAMQFHIEVDVAKLELWAAETRPDYHAAQRQWPTVHGGARILGEATAALPAQMALADRVYDRWLRHLAR
jgi:GMP synthase (glutamine-hydrolysing)